MGPAQASWSSRPRLHTSSKVLLLVIFASSLLLQPASAQKFNATTYKPQKVDWAAVASACISVGQVEKRFYNFFTRACAHDALSAIADVDCDTCEGLDGSMLLNTTELLRPENAYDNFGNITARVIKKIARFYGASVADTLSVACLVAPKGLNPKVDLFKISGLKLRVGKIDSKKASKEKLLPAGDINTKEFASFWTKRGFTVQEGVALIGSHSLIDEFGCFRGRGNDPRDHCDPYKETCTDIKMFQFDNHYFKDTCTPDVYVHETTEAPAGELFEEPPITAIDKNEFEPLKAEELCKFTSTRYRRQTIKLLNDERSGKRVDPTPPPLRDDEVFWLNDPAKCDAAESKVIRENCPHLNTWPYTVNDGHLAMACQGKKDMSDDDNQEIRKWMYKYALDNDAWVLDYAKAMFKLVAYRATKYAVGNETYIDGSECPSSYVSTDPAITEAVCKTQCKRGRRFCPKACLCTTAMNFGLAFKDKARAKKSLLAALKAKKRILPENLPADLMGPNFDTDPEPFAPELPTIAYATSDAQPGFDPLVAPQSKDTGPEAPTKTECVSKEGQRVEVNGFPSSPYAQEPFKDAFVNPPVAVRTTSACRRDKHCVVGHNFDVYAFKSQLLSNAVPSCANKDTWMLGYNGRYPGPTIEVEAGTETFVRFNNKINDTQQSVYQLGYWPCNPNIAFGSSEDGKGMRRPRGLPISVHCHGMKSVPPYDGWADDVTCTGESKDYLYPNSNPLTAWYHDHAYAQTAANVYAGLAGFYIVKDNSKCGRKLVNLPYNLEDIGKEQDLHMMISDRVIDHKCQFYTDHTGAHRNNLYGDINLISGKPWPVFKLKPTLHRLRLLNASPTRPYKIQIKNKDGQDVAQNMCWVIAADGGYRPNAAKFPFAGLILGVAERYEVVCDLDNYAGETLYLWNHRDDKIFKDVPYFCYSHLLGKIEVLPKTPGSKVVTFKPNQDPPNFHISHVLTQQNINDALAMANQGKYHRKFVFGRRKGHWVINGETWGTFKIAADDIGTNTFEVWVIKAGGGWFHPVHIHLVDLFILFRNKPGEGVNSYEQLAPKDVVYLGPSQKIWILARFGPHRGDYMFHCHNLIHEDDDMLRAFTIKKKFKSKKQTNPFYTLNSAAGPVYRQNLAYEDPMYKDAAATSSPKPYNKQLMQTYVNANVYRLFYPTRKEPRVVRSKKTNPWKYGCGATAAKASTISIPFSASSK